MRNIIETAQRYFLGIEPAPVGVIENIDLGKFQIDLKSSVPFDEAESRVFEGMTLTDARYAVKV